MKNTILKILICLLITSFVFITPTKVYSEVFNEYYHYVEWDPDNIYKDKVVIVKVPYNAQGVDTERITITVKYEDTNEIITVIDANGNKK